MSIERLLEGLDGTDDAELEDTRFDLDILDDVLTGLPDTDEDGNPISSHLYADSIMEVYGIDRDELIKLLKSSGRGLKFFDLSIEGMGSELVVGNSMCTEDDVRNGFLSSLDGLEDIEFTVTEIVDDSSDDSKDATGTAPKEPTGPIVESTTVGPDSIFGYVNGDLESFDPWSFVNKVRRRKMSLHTNRMVRDTDNLKVCHHIVCSIMGLGDKPSVYVDVVEETWERDTRIGDADSIDNYKGKMTQERILSRECGNGEDGFNEAILVLEEYKEKTLKDISKGNKLSEDATDSDSFDEFIKDADVLLVDDAFSFDINKWESELEEEIEKDTGNATEGGDNGTKKQSGEKGERFSRYRLTPENLDKVMERLSKADFMTVEGKTSWKTRQFLKKNGLEFEDIKKVLRNLKPGDYVTDSIPTDKSEEGYNEAIIFIKDTTIGDVGPLHLYIKLDYNMTEDSPVVVISFHQARGKIQPSQEKTEVEEDIEKHDTLNPKLFENDELREDVREALKRVVDAFVADLRESDIDLAVKDAVIVGSNVNYNYTKDSDLDLHIIADSSKSSYPGEVLTLLYSAYRSIFNKNYDITIKGIPCEVYVELDETGTDSNGVYSLFSGWIRKPEHEDVPDLDEEGFNKLFGEWEDRYFKLLNTLGVEPGELLATCC